MFKKISHLLLTTLFVSVVLVGCQADRITKVQDPRSPILSRETPITKELGCFGDMLATYRRMQYPVADMARVLPVAMVSVEDKSSVSKFDDIPDNMTDMAIGSLAKISGVLRILHIPPMSEVIFANTYENTSDSKYFSNFVTRHYSAHTTPSPLLIYGSLTEYDRSLQNNKSSINANVDYFSSKTREGVLRQGTSEQQVFEDRADDSGGIRFSYGDIANVSRMTMDFRIVQTFDKGTVVNESVVTNTLLLHQNAENLSFAVSVNGKSLGTLSTLGLGGTIGYANTMTIVDARHAALRMLIERSLIEVIGKRYNLPYWRCFTKEVMVENQEANELQKKLVITPNAPVSLSEVAFNAVKDKANLQEYPSVLTDPNSLADLNVIHAVKRYFKQDDYLAGSQGTAQFKQFIPRPETKDNPRFLVNNHFFLKNFNQIKNKKLSKDDKDKFKYFEHLYLTEQNKKSKNIECGKYVFYMSSDRYSPTIPSQANEAALTALLKLRQGSQSVSTQNCLMMKVIKAHGNTALPKLLSKYKLYGNNFDQQALGNLITNSDLFATLWLNIPVEFNARWKY